MYLCMIGWVIDCRMPFWHARIFQHFVMQASKRVTFTFSVVEECHSDTLFLIRQIFASSLLVAK